MRRKHAQIGLHFVKFLLRMLNLVASFLLQPDFLYLKVIFWMRPLIHLVIASSLLHKIEIN